jgi:ribonuclease-3
MSYEQLQHAIGYQFNDPSLLERALTHSSYANERKLPRGSNERLEFLGDSVLGFLAAEYLYAE